MTVLEHDDTSEPPEDEEHDAPETNAGAPDYPAWLEAYLDSDQAREDWPHLADDDARYERELERLRRLPPPEPPPTLAALGNGEVTGPHITAEMYDRLVDIYVDVAQLLAGDLETNRPDRLVLDDGRALFYSAATNGLASEPSTGKTTLACIALIQAMHGGEHVGYVDYEDRPERVLERLLALGATPIELAQHLHYLTDPHDPAAIAQLIEDATKLPLSIVVIDGIAEALSAAGLNEDIAADYAKWAAGCPKPLANTGACVVCCDHVTKAADGRGLWPRGSGHKLALIDGAQYMLTSSAPFSRERAGHIAITIAKDRAGHVGPRGSRVARCELTPEPEGILRYTLRTETTFAVIRADDLPAIPDELLVNILGAIESLTELQIATTRRSIEDRLRAEEVAFNNNLITPALMRLEMEQRVIRKNGPRNSTLYAIEETCSTPDENPAASNGSPPPAEPTDTADSAEKDS